MAWPQQEPWLYSSPEGINTNPQQADYPRTTQISDACRLSSDLLDRAQRSRHDLAQIHSRLVLHGDERIDGGNLSPFRPAAGAGEATRASPSGAPAAPARRRRGAVGDGRGHLVPSIEKRSQPTSPPAAWLCGGPCGRRTKRKTPLRKV